MLKVDMHMHSSEDKKDHVKYSAKELIDRAHKLNFDVLSFTFHDQFFYPAEIIAYAKEKGILLISGIEKTIEGKHVLLYGFSEEELEQIRHFEDIRKYKTEEKLVVAPHPFFPIKTAIKKNIVKKYLDIFDAVEFCFFYTALINYNKKAERFALKNKKTLAANSDCHLLENLGRNYSLVDAENTKEGVIAAIKKGNVQIKSTPFKFVEMMKMFFKHR